jgi:hypothetical protein
MMKRTPIGLRSVKAISINAANIVLLKIFATNTKICCKTCKKNLKMLVVSKIIHIFVI